MHRIIFKELFHYLPYHYCVLSLIMIHFRITCQFMYIAMILNISQLAGNIFINTVISGIIELFCTMLCIYLLNHYGRKKPTFVLMLMAGIGCGIAAPFELFAGNMTPPTLMSSSIVGISVKFSHTSLYYYNHTTCTH